MSSTVVVRGSGGFIFEMDTPAAGHALELFNERVTKGELTIITDPVEWVDNGDGSKVLVLVAPTEDAPEADDAPTEDAPEADDAPTEDAPEADDAPTEDAPEADDAPTEDAPEADDAPSGRRGRKAAKAEAAAEPTEDPAPTEE